MPMPMTKVKNEPRAKLRLQEGAQIDDRLAVGQHPPEKQHARRRPRQPPRRGSCRRRASPSAGLPQAHIGGSRERSPSAPARSRRNRAAAKGRACRCRSSPTRPRRPADPGTMLTRNSQCQENVSVRNPPSVGPKVDDRLRITEMIAMTRRQLRAAELGVDDRPHGRRDRAAAKPLHRAIDDHLAEAGRGGAQRAGPGEAERGDDEQHAGRQQPRQRARTSAPSRHRRSDRRSAPRRSRRRWPTARPGSGSASW